MHTLVVGDDQFEVVDAYARSMLASPLDALMIKESGSGSIVTFNDGADNTALKRCVINIDPLQAGSGDPSPANIRTLTGWTGANIAVAGKNIFNEAIANWKSGYYINASGEETSNTSYKYSQAYTKVKAETGYVLQINKGSSSSLAATVACYDENRNFISRQTCISATSSTGVVSGTFTTPEGCVWIRINVPKTETTNIQIEEGSTKTDYEAYAHNYPVSWEDEVGTVYGGTLDALNGTLTLEYDSGDLGSFAYSVINGAFRINMSNRKTGSAVTPKCSAYKYAGTINAPEAIYSMTEDTFVFYESSTTIFFKDDSYATIDAFKTAMAGQKLIWQLATPITYQLDPVVVASLLGLNNIWADTGDTDLIYVADTKTYIDNNGGSDLPSASGVNF